MKLFFQLQWQQYSIMYLFLIAVCCISPFLLSYEESSEMNFILVAYVIIMSSISTPSRIIGSRSTFEYICALPVSKKTVSKYFIYTQLFFILFVFTLIAPHHFYAAHVQQEWTLFILSYCATLWICLISHALLLPSQMRNMKDGEILETIAITIIVLVICYLGSFAILHFFPHTANIIYIVMTVFIFIFYMMRIQKYMDIRIYENVDI